MSEQSGPDSAAPDELTTVGEDSEQESEVEYSADTEHRREAQHTAQEPTEEPAEEPAEPAAGLASAEPPATEDDGDQDGLGEDSAEPATPASPPTARTAAPRTGIAPIIPVDSSPERGLSGFFDTLDDRAKDWWSQRKARKARKQVYAARDEDAVQHDADYAPAHRAGPETAARRARRHDAQAFGPYSPETPASAATTGTISLPKPPPADHRPPGQLFTGAIPLITASQKGQPGGSTPLAPELSLTPTAAEQVPSPGLKPPQPAAPGTPSADDSAEATVVLPAYRVEESHSSEAEYGTGPVRAVSPSALAPDSSPHRSTPGRIHRALDDQRQRNLIAQKATAIEAATAPYSYSQYQGTEYTESHFEFADDEEDLYVYIPPYNMPSRDPDPEPIPWDRYRRIAVSVGAFAATVSVMWMFGWFGTDPAILSGNGLREAHAGGWFSGEHALLSPDHNYYWLWPVITAGLIVHACYQWTSTQESALRQRRSGWLVGSAAALMLIVTVGLRYGLFSLVMLASVAIALCLLEALREFNLHTARNITERRLTDGIVGLFFGFSLVQATSSVSVWLTERGWHIPGIPAMLWALIGLLLCVWLAAFYSMTERGRITIALGLAWGLFWLIFPRLLSEVTSVWVAIGAAMGAFIVILCTQSRRHRINHAERRAAMGRPLEDII